MQSKLTIWKNIFWAIGILLALLAVLIGFFFAAFTKYGGDRQTGAVELGGSGGSGSGSGGGGQELVGSLELGDGTLHELAETEDAGLGYLDSLTFLCDSALIGIRDYGMLSGGTTTTQVWGSSSGSISASSLAECSIRYPADMSDALVTSAVKLAKPEILVVALGSDGRADVKNEQYKENYLALVKSIIAESPGTKLILCSTTSVTAGHSGGDGLVASDAAATDEIIREICIETGAYFADIGSAVCDNAGNLLNDYASSNGKTLNSTGINMVLAYLRTHAI